MRRDNMAANSIPANSAEQARSMIRRACGLEVNEATAARALRELRASLGLHAGDEQQVVAWLDHLSAADMAALVELVVVPESWMFRDAGAFAAASAFVANRIGPGRGAQRILSLPCAGGEEPYSMAMALADAQVPAASFRIDAIDVSEVALARARAGWYGKNAFRGNQLAFRERHFSAAGTGYQIDDAIRGQVHFSQGNLLAIDVKANAGRYDVIFCRNLLIYFDSPAVAAASAVLRALLADDGLLLAGYAEVPQLCAHGWNSLRLPGAFALQKSPVLAPPARTAPAPAPARPLRAAASPLARPATRAPAPAPAADNPALLLADARRQADSGDHAAAAASCQRLLALAALSVLEQADTYYLLGLLADARQQGDAAADHWRRCVYLRPDHYEALCRLALLAGQQGDSAGAARLRQRAARVFERGHSDGDAT